MTAPPQPIPTSIRVSCVADARTFLGRIRAFLEHTEKDSHVLFATAEAAAKSDVKCGPDTTYAFIFTRHSSDDSQSEGNIVAAAYGPVKDSMFFSGLEDRFVADVSRLFVEELLRLKTKDQVSQMRFAGPRSLMEVLKATFALHSMEEAGRMEDLSYCLTLGDLAPVNAVPGRMERPTPTEEGLLSDWLYDFLREIKLPGLNLPDRSLPPASDEEKDTMATWIERSNALTRGNIAEGNAYIWRDEKGTCVSLAVVVGQWTNGARLGSVYTPPELRGKGFSKCLIHDLCSLLLTGRHRSPPLPCVADGEALELTHPTKQMVVLFADYANPMSNAVYKRCGFKHIDDHWILSFRETTNTNSA